MLVVEEEPLRNLDLAELMPKLSDKALGRQAGRAFAAAHPVKSSTSGGRCD